MTTVHHRRQHHHAPQVHAHHAPEQVHAHHAPQQVTPNHHLPETTHATPVAHHRADATTVASRRRVHAAGDQNARARVDPQATQTAHVAPAPAHHTGASPTRDITNHLNPEHNPKYLPHAGSTFCNVFTQDVMHARGVKDFPQLTANDTNRWLHQHGAQHGWRQVSGAEAQRIVNQGGIGLVNSVNPRGHGHIAPIIEGNSGTGAPMISNAGSANFNAGPSTKSGAFRRANTEYWVRDGH